MILFDYGQTLLNEQTFNGIKGTQAVLDCCVSTLNHITAEEVQELANMLNNDIGRYNPETQDMYFDASGSGTTTLRRALKEKYEYAHFDTDDYFWIPTNPPIQ